MAVYPHALKCSSGITGMGITLLHYHTSEVMYGVLSKKANKQENNKQKKKHLGMGYTYFL